MNCNYADNEGRCTANDGEPCEACAKELAADMAYFKSLYDAAPLSERDPKAYAEFMRDAGRGHLVRHLSHLMDD